MSSVLARSDSAQPATMPIGPSVDRWRAMSEAERDHFYQQIFAASNTPEASLSAGRQERGAGRADAALQGHRPLHLRGG